MNISLFVTLNGIIIENCYIGFMSFLSNTCLSSNTIKFISVN